MCWYIVSFLKVKMRTFLIDQGADKTIKNSGM